jgi:hypothetical protein
VLVYDATSDLIVSFGVESSVDAAVAAAFEGITSPAGAGPGTLACDPCIIDSVRLKNARFYPPPTVAAASNAELRVVGGLFKDFLAGGPSERAHARAVSALEDAARHFIGSKCWAHRADSQPLLLDASIDGDRAGGIVSVMGNGGETWGLSVFRDGDAFNAVIDSDERMPPDGVLSCVLDPRALRTTTIPAVEMAVAIREGEPQPARGREVHLLHVALIAAAEAPPVGRAEPATGKVSERDFEASYVVFDMEGAEQVRTKPSSRTSGRKVRQTEARKMTARPNRSPSEETRRKPHRPRIG